MRIRGALLVALATGLAACGDRTDESLDTIPAEDLSPSPAPVESAEAVIATAQFQPAGDAAGTNVTGTAEMRRLGDDGTEGVELRVRLAGLTQEGHAWHIHEGGCDNVGSVVVPLSGDNGLADDLEADEDRNVEREVEIGSEHLAALSSNRSYSVNVHRGPGDNPGAPIACATLDLPSNLWGPGINADVPPVDAGTTGG